MLMHKEPRRQCRVDGAAGHRTASGAGGFIAQGRMGPDPVIVTPPAFDDRSRLLERVKNLAVEPLGAHAVLEFVRAAPMPLWRI